MVKTSNFNGEILPCSLLCGKQSGRWSLQIASIVVDHCHYSKHMFGQHAPPSPAAAHTSARDAV